jgi:hypothetical protein
MSELNQACIQLRFFMIFGTIGLYIFAVSFEKL